MARDVYHAAAPCIAGRVFDMAERQASAGGELAQGGAGMAQAGIVVAPDGYAPGGNVDYVALLRKRRVEAAAYVLCQRAVQRMPEPQIFSLLHLNLHGLGQQLWDKLLRTGGQGKEEDGNARHCLSESGTNKFCDTSLHTGNHGCLCLSYSNGGIQSFIIGSMALCEAKIC